MFSRPKDLLDGEEDDEGQDRQDQDGPATQGRDEAQAEGDADDDAQDRQVLERRELLPESHAVVQGTLSGPGLVALLLRVVHVVGLTGAGARRVVGGGATDVASDQVLHPRSGGGRVAGAGRGGARVARVTGSHENLLHSSSGVGEEATPGLTSKLEPLKTHAYRETMLHCKYSSTGALYA